MKQLSLWILVALLLFWTGCGGSKIVLHPITNKDICVKGEDCDMSQMDIGMSQYFLNQVLDAKIER